MNGMLQDKVALISGGARGIGRATALLFAAEGASVAVTDLDKEGANQTAEEIRRSGGQAIALGADVTDAQQVRDMVSAVASEFGRIDCAFNNAGIAPYQAGAQGQTTADWSEQAFDALIAVNLKGVWLAMREQLNLMQSQGKGVIVNTASVAGLLGLRNASGYVAAKHAVLGLTRTAAMEYAEHAIRVNAVCPGFIETEMTRESLARAGDLVIARTPMHRVGNAHEVAETVCWLCSDRASYVTGAAYTVDGGYSAA